MPGYALAQLARAIELDQNDRLIRVRTALDPDPFVVHRMHGQEGLSRPFSLVVDLLASDAHLELKRLVGQPLLLSMRAEAGERHFHGYVQEFARTGSNGGLATYRAEVAPWFAFLRHTSNCRIFQELSVVEVVDEVFASYAPLARCRHELDASRYPALSYCVQYNESDFSFVSRLLEEAGIHYRFEHDVDGHEMVLCDDSTRLPMIEGQVGVRYMAGDGAVDAHGLQAWRPRRRVGANLHSLKSFDFKQPGSPLLADCPLDLPNGRLPVLERYAYDGAARYVDSAVGGMIAAVRAEESAWQTKLFEGEGLHRRLQPGRCFVLEDHFDHQENDEGERSFVIVDASYAGANNFTPDFSGVESSEFTSRITCLRRRIPYRPQRVTPPVRMPGPQTATVVGPPGEEIHDDRYGRVKVQFHWDRRGRFDEASSCWVRVANPWAGEGMGGVSVPRIGQEVVVDFLDGDPDRPLIVGRVYNERNMPPFGSNVSGMKSKTVKGEGYNGFTMDDTDGAQAFALHAQKDMSNTVLNDQNDSVGNNRSTSVAVDESLAVGANQSITVGADRSLAVTGDDTTSISGNQAREVTGTSTTTVTGAVSQTYHAGQTLAISAGGYTESITGDYKTTLQGNFDSQRLGTWTELVTGTLTRQVDGAVSQVIGGGREVSVTGDDVRGVQGDVEDANVGNRTVSVDGNLEQGASGTCTVSSSGDMAVVSGSQVAIGVGESSAIIIDAGRIEISSNGATVVVDSTGVTINGAKIQLN